MGCRAIDPAAERTTKPINGPSPRGKTSLIPLTDVPGSLVQVTKPHVGAHVFFVARVRDKVESFVWRGTLCFIGVIRICHCRLRSLLWHCESFDLAFHSEMIIALTRRR